MNFSFLHLRAKPPESAANVASPQAHRQSATAFLTQSEPVTREALTASLAFSYGVSQKRCFLDL